MLRAGLVGKNRNRPPAFKSQRAQVVYSVDMVGVQITPLRRAAPYPAAAIAACNITVYHGTIDDFNNEMQEAKDLAEAQDPDTSLEEKYREIPPHEGGGLLRNNAAPASAAFPHPRRAPGIPRESASAPAAPRGSVRRRRRRSRPAASPPNSRSRSCSRFTSTCAARHQSLQQQSSLQAQS